jgi:hypothetical protein
MLNFAAGGGKPEPTGVMTEPGWAALSGEFRDIAVRSLKSDEEG